MTGFIIVLLYYRYLFNIIHITYYIYNVYIRNNEYNKKLNSINVNALPPTVCMSKDHILSQTNANSFRKFLWRSNTFISHLIKNCLHTLHNIFHTSKIGIRTLRVFTVWMSLPFSWALKLYWRRRIKKKFSEPSLSVI